MFLCLVNLTFYHEIDGFPGIMVENFYVKFGEPSCIGFWDTVWKNKQTNKHTNSTENPTHVTAIDWLS